MLTPAQICEELIKREISCTDCSMQNWVIVVYRDNKGIIGFDGECKYCDAIIRGWFPLYTNQIRITHNGERPQTAIYKPHER
jgi:hypothetical protein